MPLNVTMHRTALNNEEPAPNVSNVEVKKPEEHWRGATKHWNLGTKLTSYIKTGVMEIIRQRAGSYMV